LCFGDSITEGTYIDGDWVKYNSWVSEFQKLAGDSFEVINGGKSGRRTFDMDDVGEAVKTYAAIDHVVLFLGVNDLKISTTGVFENCVRNTETMIDRFREAYGNAEVTILSSPGLDVPNVIPVFANEGYDSNEQAMLDKLRFRYWDLAKKKHCHFIDLWGVVPPENIYDGLHPATIGQRQIAMAVWRHWKRTRHSANTSTTNQVPDGSGEYDWKQRHLAVCETIKRKQQVDLIFLGDSITHYMGGDPQPIAHIRGQATWDKYYAKHKAVNMGFGCDRTQHVLWRIDHGEGPC
jgi:lysophospholipase L1-like esterase